MEYERTNWETGDVISADKLNNIEDGIERAWTPSPNYRAVAMFKTKVVGDDEILCNALNQNITSDNIMNYVSPPDYDGVMFLPALFITQQESSESGTIRFGLLFEFVIEGGIVTTIDFTNGTFLYNDTDNCYYLDTSR